MVTRKSPRSMLLPRLTTDVDVDHVSRPLSDPDGEIGGVHLSFVRVDGSQEVPVRWADDNRALNDIEAEARENLKAMMPTYGMQGDKVLQVRGPFAAEALLLLPRLAQKVARMLNTKSIVIVLPTADSVSAAAADDEESVERLCQEGQKLHRTAGADALLSVGLIIRGREVIGTVRAEQRISRLSTISSRVAASFWNFWPRRLSLGFPKSVLVDFKFLSVATLYMT